MNNQTKVLHTADASAAAGGQTDPFSEAAGGYDTSFPVLMPDRLLRFSVRKAEKVTNTEEGKESLHFEFRLEEDSVFRDGRPIRVGFICHERVGVSPTEKYTTADIKRRLASLIKGIFGQAKADTISFRAFIDGPAMAEGLHFMGRTSVKKGSGGYGDSTQVTPVPPAA